MSKSHLVPKRVVNKNGVTTTVYVNPDQSSRATDKKSDLPTMKRRGSEAERAGILKGANGETLLDLEKALRNAGIPRSEFHSDAIVCLSDVPDDVSVDEVSTLILSAKKIAEEADSDSLVTLEGQVEYAHHQKHSGRYTKPSERVWQANSWQDLPQSYWSNSSGAVDFGGSFPHDSVGGRLFETALRLSDADVLFGMSESQLTAESITGDKGQSTRVVTYFDANFSDEEIESDYVQGILDDLAEAEPDALAGRRVLRADHSFDDGSTVTAKIILERDGSGRVIVENYEQGLYQPHSRPYVYDLPKDG